MSPALLIRACGYCRKFLGFKCSCLSEQIAFIRDGHLLRCDGCGSVARFDQGHETTGACDECRDREIAKIRKVARPAGLEPATTGLEGRCSIQLSYGRDDSNSTNHCSVCTWPLHKSTTAGGVELLECVNSDCAAYLSASMAYARSLRVTGGGQCAS
jgi:hypothetical protein